MTYFNEIDFGFIEFFCDGHHLFYAILMGKRVHSIAQGTIVDDDFFRHARLALFDKGCLFYLWELGNKQAAGIGRAWVGLVLYDQSSLHQTLFFSVILPNAILVGHDLFFGCWCE